MYRGRWSRKRVHSFYGRKIYLEKAELPPEFLIVFGPKMTCLDFKIDRPNRSRSVVNGPKSTWLKNTRSCWHRQFRLADAMIETREKKTSSIDFRDTRRFPEEKLAAAKIQEEQRVKEEQPGVCNGGLVDRRNDGNKTPSHQCEVSSVYTWTNPENWKKRNWRYDGTWWDMTLAILIAEVYWIDLNSVQCIVGCLHIRSHPKWHPWSRATQVWPLGRGLAPPHEHQNHPRRLFTDHNWPKKKVPAVLPAEGLFWILAALAKHPKSHHFGSF